MTVHKLALSPGIHQRPIDPKHQVLLNRLQVSTEMRSQFELELARLTRSTEPVTLCMNSPVEALLIFALSGNKTRYAFKHWAVHLHRLSKGKVSFSGARELLAQSIGFDCYLTAKQSEVSYTYVNVHGPSCLNQRFFLSPEALQWFTQRDVKIH